MSARARRDTHLHAHAQAHRIRCRPHRCKLLPLDTPVPLSPHRLPPLPPPSSAGGLPLRLQWPQAHNSLPLTPRRPSPNDRLPPLPSPSSAGGLPLPLQLSMLQQLQALQALQAGGGLTALPGGAVRAAAAASRCLKSCRLLAAAGRCCHATPCPPPAYFFLQPACLLPLLLGGRLPLPTLHTHRAQSSTPTPRPRRCLSSWAATPRSSLSRTVAPKCSR